MSHKLFQMLTTSDERLPATNEQMAVGIFRSNLDTEAQPTAEVDNSDHSLQWMAGRIGQHIHDPYESYEEVASS